jgi:hypothetical protein
MEMPTFAEIAGVQLCVALYNFLFPLTVIFQLVCQLVRVYYLNPQTVCRLYFPAHSLTNSILNACYYKFAAFKQR